MASILWKDGVEGRFPAERVQAALAAGWKTQREAPGDQKPVVLPTEEEIRAQAKELGIRNYWNKNLDTLRAEIEHQG